MHLHYEDPQFDEAGCPLYATHVIFEGNDDQRRRELLTEQLQAHVAELALAGIAFEVRATSIFINHSVSKEAVYMFMNFGPPLHVGAPNPKSVTADVAPDPRYL